MRAGIRYLEWLSAARLALQLGTEAFMEQDADGPMQVGGLRTAGVCIRIQAAAGRSGGRLPHAH